MNTMDDKTRSSQNWELRKGTTILALILDCTTDMPWYVGRFSPLPAFSEFEELFIEQTQIVDSNTVDQNYERLEEILHQLNADLRLVPGSGNNSVSQFMMNIRGQTAWIRVDFDDHS